MTFEPYTMTHLDYETAVRSIHALLDGKEWDSETMSEVANIIESAGFTIRAYEELEESDE